MNHCNNCILMNINSSENTSVLINNETENLKSDSFDILMNDHTSTVVDDGNCFNSYHRKDSITTNINNRNNLNNRDIEVKKFRRKSFFSSPHNSEIDYLNLHGTYMDYKFDHHEPKQQQSTDKFQHRHSLSIIGEKENLTYSSDEKVRRKSWHEKLYERKRKKSLALDTGSISDNEQTIKNNDSKKFKQKRRNSWWQLFLLNSRPRRASYDSIKFVQTSVNHLRNKSRSVDQGFSTLAESQNKNADDGKQFQKKINLPETDNYTVTSQDTLTSIAARFDITPSELKKLNKLTTTFIFPGQQLKVPVRQSEIETVNDGQNQIASTSNTLLVGTLKTPPNSPSKDDTEVSISPTRNKFTKEQFLKLNAKHITDNQVSVNGVILVTPNAVIFDPNVSDPLVIENGQETYGVVAPMEYVVNIAIFYNHFTTNNSKNPIYYPNTVINETPSDTFPELAVSIDSVSGASNTETDNQNEGNAFPKAFDQDLITSLEDDNRVSQSNTIEAISQETFDTPDCSKQINIDDNLNQLLCEKKKIDENIQPILDVQEKKSSSVSFNLESNETNMPSNKDNRRNKMLKRLSYPLNWMETWTTDSKDDDKSNPSGSSSADSNHSSSVFTKFFPRRYSASTSQKPSTDSQVIKSSDKISIMPKVDYVPGFSAQDMPELFLELDKLVPKPTKAFDYQPLFLRLVMGKPVNKPILSRSTSAISYGKQEIHMQYWWSIPRNKVDDLYNFIQSLNYAGLYGELNEETIQQRGFELIEGKLQFESKKNTSCDTENIESHELTDLTKDSWEKIKAPYVKLFSMLKSTSLQSTDYKDMEENLRLEHSYSSITLDSDISQTDLLDGTSEILSHDHIEFLYKSLPARCITYNWTLLFSTNEHGFSLNSLYRKMKSIDSPILMVIQDTHNNIFGALTSCTFHISEHFYGTGESFLFRLTPNCKVYNWTGNNEYFIRTDSQNLTIGSGDGKFGLWLDNDLYHGRSEPCKTYNNEPLSSDGCDFFVKTLECWCFV